MKFIVDDSVFKCSIHGSEGPLVFLLHGFGGGPLDWHNLVPALENQCRLIVPNLSPLFTSTKPFSFSKQIQLLSHLISQINSSGEPFILIGSSFGATLSFGMRAHFRGLVLGQAMINPMPLEPLAHLRSTGLRALFGMNMVPGALPLFLKTSMGKDLLTELGEVFGLGMNGRRELGGLSKRKLTLVTKAVQRFAWIAQNENWDYWQNQLKDHHVPTLILASPDDELFTEKEFRSYQLFIPLSEYQPLSGGGHVAVRANSVEVAKILERFISDIKEDKPQLFQNKIRRAI